MNPYEILGIHSESSQEDIDKAYRLKAKLHHPDRRGGSHEKMSEINQAYALIGTPEARACFDRGEPRQPSPLTVDQEAEINVRGLLATIILQGDEYANFLSTAQANMSIVITQFQKGLKDAEKKVSLLEKRKAQVEKKSPGENFILDVIESQIRGLQAGEEIAKHQLKVALRAQELLNEYVWTGESRPNPPFFTISTNQGIFK